jgi:hypothetical protein
MDGPVEEGAMAFSFEAGQGTTFLYNQGLAGNVTILLGNTQVTVPAADLLEFFTDVAGPGRGATPPAARAAGAETAG